MDLQDFVHFRFNDMYKTNPRISRRSKRLTENEAVLARKSTRNTVLLQRRNIQESDFVSPQPSTKPVNEENKAKKDRKKMLERWKLDKENRLKQEKSKQKPAFKVSAAANVGFPDIKKIPVIKPTAKNSSKSNDRREQHSFAPKNFVFKAPVNIKPLKMDFKPMVAIKTIKDNACQRVTRSQKPVASPPLPLPNRRTKKTEIPSKIVSTVTTKKVANVKTSKNLTKKLSSASNPKKSPLVRQNNIDLNESKVNQHLNGTNRKSVQTRRSIRHRPDFDVSEIESNKENDASNPQVIVSTISNEENQFKNMSTAYSPGTCCNTQTTVYVSPFVTLKRGKGSMRKENKERVSQGIPSFLEHFSPDKDNSDAQSATTTYFHTVLDNEILRLEGICDIWNKYKEVENPSEDATELIDVAVGQANLLMNKKFQQFRGLIHTCQNKTGDKPVTCEDLQGFWDMIYMQVENLDMRFNKLSEMKGNNWEEIKREEKKKVVKRKAPIKSKKAGPSSNLRAAIMAARNKNKEQLGDDTLQKETVFNGGFFLVRSPRKSSPAAPSPRKTPGKGRKSLLATVLTANSEKKMKSSPGMTMLRASQTAKTMEIIINNQKELTPAKGILKNAVESAKSSRKSKTVLFQDNDYKYDEAPVPTVQLNSSDLIVFDSPRDNPRRSSRRVSKVLNYK